MKVNCETCGVVFNKKPCYIKVSAHDYCSKKCSCEARHAGRRAPISGVYAIINILDFKIYCGASCDVIKRMYAHFKKSTVKHHNNKMYKDMDFFGREFFHFTLLEKVENPELLKEREEWWIKNLNAVNVGYNVCGDPKPKKPKERKERKRKRDSDDYIKDTLEMIRLKEEGMFLYKIGRIFGVGESTVQRRIKLYNDRSAVVG